MTTRLFSTVINHSNDAGFRAWATELYNELIAAGLTQTSDTGQLATPVVAARPAGGAAAGYWIFRFNDTHQGTSPIFIKIEPGSGSTTIPGLWATVGTGTNGSGTITGIFMSRINLAGVSAINAAIAYPTYICTVDGFFGLAWKSGAQGAQQGNALLIIGRSADTNGDPTADGVSVLYGTGTATATAISYDFGTSTTVTNTTGYHSIVHYGLTNSAVGADFQVFKHYGVFGRVQSLSCQVTVINTEVPDGTTFSTAVVGTTAHTFINVGLAGSKAYGSAPNMGVYRVAMLWE